MRVILEEALDLALSVPQAAQGEALRPQTGDGLCLPAVPQQEQDDQGDQQEQDAEEEGRDEEGGGRKHRH